jgi:hypothetical protein
LLNAITNPATIKALTSMLLGPSGSPTIPVGGLPVNVGAFGNMLSVLAGRAASEYNAAMAPAGEATPSYFRDYAGEAVGDAAVPAQRADALYELLEATQAEQESEAFEAEAAEGSEAFEAEAEAEAEAWELLDAIDAFESESESE